MKTPRTFRQAAFDLPLVLAALAIGAPAAGQQVPPTEQSSPQAGPGRPELLTDLEATRHKAFSERAAAGGIDLVFIGDSAVDFWRNEGKDEWDKNFSDLAAVNFGVQGATSKSTLWRLQHGELDGFAAKVIVLDAIYASDFANRENESDILSTNTAIVAELRKRQPQATILLMSVPRMRASAAMQAAARNLFVQLAEPPSVEFIDVRNSYMGSNGMFNGALGGTRGNALNSRGYAIWAAALTPKLDELLK